MKTNIKKLRKKAGLSQTRLGEILGWEQGRLSHYETGRRRAGLNELKAIADALGVGVKDLIQDDDQPDSNVILSNSDIRKIPIISWVQAGDWSEAIDNYQPGHGEEYATTTKKTGPNAFALKISGDSMEPLFPNGGTIIVDPSVEAKNGSYVVVRLEGTHEATFKQLVIDGGHSYLKPVNPRYPLMPINGEASICGVVTQLLMDF